MKYELSIADLRELATATAKSGFFSGVETPDKALVLMAIAQAEGSAPIQAMQRYHVIKGKPSKQAWAMLADFTGAGGKVEWHEHNAQCCKATFSHPQGGTVTVEWTIAKARDAGLAGNDNWRKYPENMLHARCVSNGVRFVFPAAANGLYTPEEMQDIDNRFSAIAAPEEPVKHDVEVVSKKQEERPSEALPPLPEEITTIPATILLAIKPLTEANLADVAIGDMNQDQLELVVESVGSFYERYSKSKKATELGLKWQRAIVAEATAHLDTLTAGPGQV